MRAPLAALLLAAVALLAGCKDSPPEAAASDTLEVILVRHGEAWTNIAPTGSDALTPKGEAQIAAAASALAPRHPKQLFTSPLGRTRESAAILGAAFGLEPVVDPALAPFKEGEPTVRAFDFMKARRGPGPIVVVTHSDVIKAVTGVDVKTGGWVTHRP